MQLISFDKDITRDKTVYVKGNTRGIHRQFGKYYSKPLGDATRHRIEALIREGYDTFIFDSGGYFSLAVASILSGIQRTHPGVRTCYLVDGRSTAEQVSAEMALLNIDHYLTGRCPFEYSREFLCYWPGNNLPEDTEADELCDLIARSIRKGNKTVNVYEWMKDKQQSLHGASHSA